MQELENIARQTLSACLQDNAKERDIDSLVLVGSSSDLSELATNLQTVWNKEMVVNPYNGNASALGAGIYAAFLAGKVTEKIIIDRLPRSLGLILANGERLVMLPRNLPAFVKKAEYFSRLADKKNEAIVGVFEGDGEDWIDLGILRLDKVSAKQETLIEITLNVRMDERLLTIEAKDLTGRSQISVDVKELDKSSDRPEPNLVKIGDRPEFTFIKI